MVRPFDENVPRRDRIGPRIVRLRRQDPWRLPPWRVPRPQAEVQLVGWTPRLHDPNVVTLHFVWTSVTGEHFRFTAETVVRRPNDSDSD